MNNKEVLFVYGGFESYGIEILSGFLKEKGYCVELFFFSKLFSDSILEIEKLAGFFRNREIKALIEILGKKRPVIVCFSVVSNDYSWALSIAWHIKRYYPEIRVIFGGIHPTLVPEKVISENSVDFVCEGAGEMCLYELCRRLDSDMDFSKVPNLWYKNGDRIIRPSIYSDFFRFGENSMPDKELFCKKAPYFSADLSFQFSRGCPYSCSFCFHSYRNRKMGNSFIYLTPDEAVHELKNLTHKGFYRNVIFDDDMFIFDRKWIMRFLKLYRKKINIPFMCVIHVRFIDKRILSELKRSGCMKIELAVQTLNSSVRNKILKRTENNSEINNAVNLLDLSGIDYNIQHMMGIPGTDISDEEKAVRFYSRFRIRRIYTFFLTYYPKTEITEYALINGIISKEKYNNIDKGIVSSYELSGDIEKSALGDYEAIRVLFSIIPIVPGFLVRFFSRNRRYVFLRKLSFLFRVADIVNVLRNNDRTARIYIKRYIYHLTRFFSVR